jgi:hypothetical protein
MQLATKKATSFIQEMEKLIVGANPANDDDFFKEVWMLEPNVVYKFHIWFYVLYLQPPSCKSISISMKFNAQDDCQKTTNDSTTPIRPTYMVRWLNWWFPSSMSCKSFCNPVGDVKKDELEAWLVKASFWVHYSDWGDFWA